MALTKLNSASVIERLPVGSVLQTVQSGRTTRVTHNTNTYTDIGVSASITPSSTSSNILITFTGTIGNSLNGNYTFLKLFRGSTEIGSGTGSSGGAAFNVFTGMMQAASPTTYAYGGFGQTFLDEDVSTTSAVTYKIQMATYNGVGSLGGRGDSTHTSNPTLFTLQEIKG